MSNMKKPVNEKERERKMGTRKRVTLSIVGLALIIISVISFFIDPLYLILIYKTSLSKGSLYYNILQTPDIPGAYVQAYVFNITNADKFISGIDSKLKVEEIGPFTYQEFRTNADFKLDEELGVMRYSPKIHPTFVSERSIGDPKNVNITVPNIAMLALSSAVSKSSFLTRMGFNMLAKRLQSNPILNINAHQYLWGFEEPLIKFGHNVMPGLITFEKMGLLDRLYNIGNFSFELGSTNKDKFKIKTYNGDAGLTQLGYEVNPSRCNTFEDTYEGIVYPPDITKETPLRLYRNVFCRIFNLQYLGTRTMDYGPEVFRYTFRDDSYLNNTDNICLCKDEECVNGISDISPCFFGLSLALSNAHFLDADPSLYERIEGIEPNEELHGSEILIEPKLGTVVATKLTMQLNVQMANVNFNSATSPFTDMIVPAAYFKLEQPELKDAHKRDQWLYLKLLPRLLHSVEGLLLIIGFALLALIVKSFLPPIKMNEMNEKMIMSDFKQTQPLFGEKQNN